MNLLKRSRQPTACPSCQSPVEAEQLSCVECGTMLTRRSALAGVAWQLPVVTVGAVALVMATGIGYASGAVVQDGDVSVAEAPPSQGAVPGLPEASGGDGDGDGGGSDDLAELDPPDGGGGGDGSSLDDGDGDGDGDGGDGDGDGSDGGDNDDGGDDGDGDGDGDASSGDDGGDSDGGSPPEEPENPGPERDRELAKLSGGFTGYTVALKVTSSRSAAVREAQSAANEAAEGTIPAGVASRSEFPSLPGPHVAFAGEFETRADAERAQDNYASLGFSGEVIFVGNSGG